MNENKQYLENYTGVSSREILETRVIDYDNPNQVNKSILEDGRDRSNWKEYNKPNWKPNYAANNKKEAKKGVISKFLSNMSRYGLEYGEDVYALMRAIPADPKLLAKDDQMLNQDLFTQLTSNWKKKQNADQNFFEKDLGLKRESLRKLALQPELEDILDVMTNEAIVYDADNAYFIDSFLDEKILGDIKPEVVKQIKESLSTAFLRFYYLLGWKTRAWDDFKRFLIEGVLAYLIIYDDISKPKVIKAIVPLDPLTLTRTFKNGKTYWIQFKGVQGKERTLLDAEVVYITYQETNVINRTSYLERLVRPFNIYRIIEQAQIIWTTTNSQYRTKFTIPTGSMNKVQQAQTLNAAMNRYKEDIRFTSETGELTINGQINMPFNKEYWFADAEAGSPSVEVLGGEGPEMNDNDQLKYFKNQLYKISKVPLSRFDQEDSSTFFGTDITSVARTEMDFGRFINRLRNIFSQIILKPLQLQVALDIPELRQDKYILDAINIQYKSYNVFEELLEQELMQKRVEFIQTMKDSLVDMDANGNDVKFWSSKFLVQKYLKLSDAELELNSKLKEQEKTELSAIDATEVTTENKQELDKDVLLEDKGKDKDKKKKQKSKDSSKEEDNKKKKEEE